MNLKKLENIIYSKHYNQAIEMLIKMAANPQRDLLLATAYYETGKNDKALSLLYELFFYQQEYFIKNFNDRKKLVDLLDSILTITDPESHQLMNKQFEVFTKESSDILKAFYLGGAKHDFTFSEIVYNEKKKIEKSLTRGRTIATELYFIEFLKKYSSYTPLLQSTVNESVGGGYFICLNNYGLVVDPGHHYLDNFYKNHRSFEDIDGILVTHFHDDHYAELPALLSLIHQSKKYDRLRNKKYDLFLDIETYNNFYKLFNNSSRFRKIIKLKYYENNKKTPIKIQDGIFLEALPAKHSTLVKNSSVGILITLKHKKIQLFITGDTGWSEELGRVYKKKNIFNNCILVAHVSTIFPTEILTYLEGKPKYYDKHLCIHGLINTIECLKPKSIILSEIGEELSPVIAFLKSLIHYKYGKKCLIGYNGLQEHIN